jgi:hypothetical protein
MYLFSEQETKRVAWKFLQVRGVLHKLLPIRYQSMMRIDDESPPVSAEDEKVTYTRLLREPHNAMYECSMPRLSPRFFIASIT